MLEGVQFQDECAPFEVQDFHHEGVTLVSNPKVIPKAVLCSLVRLGAYKM
jgi:hypothetical protein